MQIGEAIAVLTVSDDGPPCPFCASKADDKPVTRELINDSSKLAKALRGQPNKVMSHPLCSFKVAEAYYVTETISRMCMNAHHVIPGNASLGKCPEIMQWMAGELIIRKVFYDQAINLKVKEVHPTLRDAERKRLVEEKYPAETLYGTPDLEIVYSTKNRRSGISREKSVAKKNLVTGYVEFEINDVKNGEWLPGHNAVIDWAEMKSRMATDASGKGAPQSFNVMYVHHAMRATDRQFHDTHVDYSNSVRKKLVEFADKLNELATDCLEHPGTRSKSPDGPFPAPQRLRAALEKLAGIIRDKKLTLGSTKPDNDWATSVYGVEAGKLL